MVDATSLDEPSEWSEPVWLGPVVNSTARDWRPVVPGDGMRLYFHSNRPGVGGMDLWMSRRSAPDCEWQTPVNLGPVINTIRDDGDPAFSPGGRLMFFASDGGHAGAGRGDIFVSRLSDPDDDLSWDTPTNLGAAVNTAAHEAPSSYVASEEGGTLYFERGTALTGDIYRIRVSALGEVMGEAELVSALSAPDPNRPLAAYVRADGRELFFYSGGMTGTRPGSVGIADIWVSTRQSVNAPWSEPRNLGTPVNSLAAELAPTLSQDGRTLYFSASQARGGLGLQDMWMTTRGHRGSSEGVNAGGCGP